MALPEQPVVVGRSERGVLADVCEILSDILLEIEALESSERFSWERITLIRENIKRLESFARLDFHHPSFTVGERVVSRVTRNKGTVIRVTQKSEAIVFFDGADGPVIIGNENLQAVTPSTGRTGEEGGLGKKAS